MFSLNMIGTQGGGIKRMFQTQRRRFFPLLDYDLSQPKRVMVTLRGSILDVRYTRLLMAQGELDLGTIMLLDKVQKGQRIDAIEAKRLKAAKLVEGRYPNLLVADPIRPRLESHYAQKDFWTRAIGFITRENGKWVFPLVDQALGITRTSSRWTTASVPPAPPPPWCWPAAPMGAWSGRRQTGAR